MTKEIAIRILTGDVLGTTWQKHEAVRMAVEALLQSERKRGKWKQHYVGQERTPWGSDCSVCGEWLVIDRLVMN